MDNDNFLPELAKKLYAVKRRNLATQRDIETATGVNQAMISRVMHGKCRRVTDRLRRLDKYVNMLISDDEMPNPVRDAAREFLGRGGSEAELIACILHSANLVSGKLR